MTFLLQQSCWQYGQKGSHYKQAVLKSVIVKLKVSAQRTIILFLGTCKNHVIKPEVLNPRSENLRFTVAIFCIIIEHNEFFIRVQTVVVVYIWLVFN